MILLLTALKNLFFRSPILHWLHVPLDFEIPWIEGYAVPSTHFVSSVIPWFINSEPLPTFSVLQDAWSEEDNLCCVPLAALPFLWNLMLSQWWCCQFYWLFFILKALSKGKGQWNAWPQCNTLLWGVGCWVKWHLGQHCSMPRKEQKLFPLANLQS